jgi:hypothetical protein
VENPEGTYIVNSAHIVNLSEMDREASAAVAVAADQSAGRAV